MTNHGPHDESASDDTNVDRALHDALNSETPESAKDKMKESLGEFRRELADHPYIRRLEAGEAGSGRRDRPPWQRFFAPRRLALLGGGTGLAGLALIAVLIIGRPAPTWADVAEQFRSVPFFSMVLYARGSALEEPTQTELWMGPRGRARARVESQVVFGQSGIATRAFDIVRRKEIEPDDDFDSMFKALDPERGFSIETLMRIFGSEHMVETTPLVNADAVVSKDLVVFDFVPEHELGDWARIWALAESRLPVRVRIWDPTNGESGDILFTYTTPQPDRFFDPEAFAARLADTSWSSRELAYAFLDDSGGRRLRRGKLDRSAAAETVSRTMDGEPWSLADHRGKVILLDFWDTPSGIPNLSRSKRLRESLGAHDDFLMVSVCLDAKADAAREYCRKYEIDWLQLHEPGKRFRNSLAEAFGVDTIHGSWMIHRDGTIQEGACSDEIQGAVRGLNYAAAPYIARTIPIGKDKDAARQILRREPDSTTNEGDREIWRYRFLTDEQTASRDVWIAFDEAGKCVGRSSTGKILAPAFATVLITEEYWNTRAKPENMTEDAADLKGQYKLHLLAISEDHSKYLPVDWTEGAFFGKEHRAKLVPGTYDFHLSISDIYSDNILQQIPLRKGVTLPKGETTEIRFE